MEAGTATPHPTFHRPGTIEECIKLLKQPGALAVAGCTDVLPLMKRGQLRPAHIVDLTSLPGLDTREHAEGTTTIGALATMAGISNDTIIGKTGACLQEAARELGSPLIRERATIGGNICNASPANDTGPALMVLGANVLTSGPGGERIIPITDFFLGVNRTALQQGEIVRGVEYAWTGEQGGSAFVKIKRRRTLNISVVNAAALVSIDDGRIARARLALGSVAPTTVLAKATSSLEGYSIKGIGKRLGEVSQSVVEEVAPITDQRASDRYRLAMVEVAARRALERAMERARGGSS